MPLFRAKNRLGILSAILFAGVLAAQGLPDTPANRAAAAQRYLKAVPPSELVADTLDRVASQVPDDRREEFKKALAKVVKSERIEKLTREALIKHFTVREINALTAFYGSPEGRSITKKFGAYLADVMPAMQQELSNAIEEIHKEIQ
ncbi:MAG: DUF2059 domain-containing protein [Acidobacteriales bacterium]|nr:MAG: DUF2059 domain-containing protein [Terriglobales bacterium]